MLPYFSRDVATDPPTPLVIIEKGSQPPPMDTSNETIFAITEDCVEPTEGWINREGKPLLTVCFMHSFGKCTGRTDMNPRTCYQIHLNQAVLNSLRKHYSNPTRRFFSRTVKATLGTELRSQLSAIFKKKLKVVYLEYRVHDVYNTLGFSRYEAAYRQWLFSDIPPQKDGFPGVSSEQCTIFAQTFSCPNGKQCPFIHASPHHALVRDPVLSQALKKLCTSRNTGTSSVTSDTISSLSDIPVSIACSELSCLIPQSANKGLGSAPGEGTVKKFPIPVYLVEKTDGCVTARLVPLTWQNNLVGQITPV